MQFPGFMMQSTCYATTLSSGVLVSGTRGMKVLLPRVLPSLELLCTDALSIALIRRFYRRHITLYSRYMNTTFTRTGCRVYTSHTLTVLGLV